MASKVLYNTNQPKMLRALIGNELTSDFIAFIKQKIITLDDVLNHNYTQDDLIMDTSQSYVTAINFSTVDINNFEIVRDFMKQIGDEPRAMFESIWAKNDDKRLEKIAELQMNENLSKRGLKK